MGYYMSVLLTMYYIYYFRHIYLINAKLGDLK